MNEFRLFVKKYCPDAILLQETHLRPDRKIFLANYNSYYSYRANQHPQHPSGGTAILIRNNIPHNQIIPPNLRYVEACVVAINFKNQDPITLTSIYVPPTSDTSIFTFDIEVLLQISPNQILCGDYNTQHTSWGCNYDCPRRNSIKAFPLQAGLEILAPSTPTRFGTNSANTIDFAIVKNFLYPYEIHSISELGSDNNPITLNFFLQYSIPKYPGKLKTDWKKFKDTLKNSEFISPHFVNTAEHLDSIVCRLEDEIINAKISSSNPFKENYIYHDSKLRELNSARNLARKMFQTYRDPVLKRKLNKLNKQINKLDQKIETDAFTNERLNVNATDGTVWKFVTPFKKKTKNIPSLNGPGGIANTDLEKANFLADILETQFTLNNITNPETEELVADSVMRFRTEANSVCKDFDHPLPSEVLDCVKSLRINKAPGIDGISKKMIKNLPLHTILTITTIIHKIMTLGHFPTRWKTATVVPILKPGKDPTDTTSYRPISLLPSLSKIAEHLILKRLNNYLKENNVLCPEQFGFRQKLSTSHQLIRVVEYVTEGFTNKQKTGAVFLDIQKAFDRVWQDGLIHKLIHYKTPSYLIKLIDSYLLERKFAVRVKNELSSTKNINAGVAQGSKIGPTFFALYINDIPKQFNTLLCMYADDIAILARNKVPIILKLILFAILKHLRTGSLNGK
ncbi:RNA-directed DNA polymerase from mobile element jockey [Araneus ventricosus]|uniref:RNA-directed DNA polymerase from mobile element jockey n=1 Tax=Araneus ventricosus TaxID=182803 RepID=A0A4Y2RS13_ARAVE|nr:RNA-directed DNA polymerase from mobile element jockey [Araneus ventricosus]